MGNALARAGLAGPALILLAIALFSANDVAMKLLSAGFGAAQVITWRCGVGLALVGPVALAQAIRTRGIPRARLALQLLRAVLIHCSGLTFFVAFARLPLFDAYVVFFTAPFVTLALARVLLGEVVPRTAWLWASLGFAGVALALSPGIASASGAGRGPLIGYLAAFAGTCSYALLMVVTRRLGPDARLAESMSIPALAGLAAIGPFAAMTWQAPSAADIVLLSLTGALWAGGNVSLTAAIRFASPARLAPYDFTAMVWAIGYDALVFGTAPGAVEVAGAAVVVAACLGHARSDSGSGARRGRA
ncbi:DMT family transporter [Elioraea tepida]|uniref:DMT family transporter n=1 Tax=Elioraea tepida TaxID=2843330 RepID=A0A975U2T6_9PROT|nr:DMT family transporter [Elioraea tepida]QXM24718.1 DMT family transporter [Elioraea tepida]